MTNWDIGPSCQPYRRVLDEGFDVALEMAVAAYDAMDLLRKPQPAKRQRKQHLEWSIKARSLKAVLGLTVQENGSNPPEDFIFAQTTPAVFSRIKTRLTQSPNPVRNPQLERLGYTKPYIVCGENTEGEEATFKWVGADDPVPNEGGVLLKDYKETKRQIEKGFPGAWFHHGRIVYVHTVKQKGFICGPGVSALIDYRYDWIAFCERAFRPEVMSRTSPKTYKEIDGKTKKQKDRILDKIIDGTPLKSIAGHLSVTVLHELSHWYGLPKPNPDGRLVPVKYSKHTSARIISVFQIESGTKQMLTRQDIIDVQAVNDKGEYLYKTIDPTKATALVPLDRRLTIGEMRDRKLAIVAAYGQRHVWNLAKSFHDDENSKPVVNADSLAYFALMV
ncbi:hypothetical protein FPHYL_10936 [Fusarium phyllophilum]|uniref:Uncharacterized protein n=1 Tax=Fusarium phyllophilum TaxID=47803 RepID=A0A8H5IWV1_9HYPO|nr:hypothetical protein FPHYL_10936 [Fusarium phyllophilum]